MNISQIGEFGLIGHIASKFNNLIPPSCQGIGDDCAVIPFSEEKSLVITTDMLVEDIHFLRNRISAYELGYKSLSVNLSDIAAMGATAHSTFLSLAFPSSLDIKWCEEFFDGYRAHNVALLGGDTTKSTDKIVINVTAIGVADNNCLKFRNGAKVGDKIYVTACLGDSAAGLRAILDDKVDLFPELIKAHNFPVPHLKQGITLGENSDVTAMMDVSDGIASDLRHILRASNVGAQIELTKIPLSDKFSESGLGGIELALTGGEDYCLLFTASPNAILNYDFDCFEIGLITQNCIGEIEWMHDNITQNICFNGFTHF